MDHGVRVGTSGWIYRSWRGVLYEEGVPERRWLERYAKTFTTVELNASFYRLPSADQFSSWRTRTPAGFTFAVKGSRLVTHLKRLAGVAEDVATFAERVRRLGPKLSVVLWQLPPDFERDDKRLGAFLDLLEGSGTSRHAVEFRHPSWYVPDVYGLLEQRGVALVLPDSAARPSMRAPELRTTAGFTYLRLHHGGGRGGEYTDAQLRLWGRRIRAWSRARDVFVYFNNDWNGFAVRNALRLSEMLRARSPRSRPAE